MAKSKLDLMYKKEQEEELKKKYGVKQTTPNVKILMGKNEEKMKTLTGDSNFGSTVKNAFVKGATLGPEISLIKGSMDLAGDTLDKRLVNGASDKEAAEAGFVRGAVNAAGEVGVNHIIGKTNPFETNRKVNYILEKFGVENTEDKARYVGKQFNDSFASGIVSVGNSAIDTFEDEKRVFNDTVAGFRKQGLDQKQARKSAISELLKKGGSQALYDSVMTVAEKQFYDALQRRR